MKQRKVIKGYAIIFQDEQGQVIHTFKSKKIADEFYKQMSEEVKQVYKDKK